MVDTEKKRADKQDIHSRKIVRLLIPLVYLIVLGLSFLFSLWNAGFDISKIQWGSLVGNVLIFWAITVLLLAMALIDGSITLKAGTKYMSAREGVSDVIRVIMHRGLLFAFQGYTHKDYLRRRHDYLFGLLMHFNLVDDRIMTLNREQLKSLRTKPLLTEIDGKEVAFDVLSDEQYVLTIDIKDGKYKYPEISSDWFLSLDSNARDDRYNYYAFADKNRKHLLAGQVALRLVSLFLLTFLFTGLTISNVLDNKQALIQAISRVLTGISAIASGYLLAFTMIEDEISGFEYRKNHCDSFMSDYVSGVYIPENINDVVKQKLAEMEETSVSVYEQDAPEQVAEIVDKEDTNIDV